MAALKSPTDLSWIAPWFDPRLYELSPPGALPGLEAVMNESVLSGGKRLRPFLMGRFAALFGVTHAQILPFARAAEQIHSATHAHDDVIDEADLRRGVRTLNARVENRRAVLGGDYLLANGIFEVAGQKNFPILESLSSTLRELVTGELLQNEARGLLDISATHLARVADLKTGSLFRWCCAVPAHLAEGSPAALRLTRDFGTRIGHAFQMIDDLLDYSEKSEKPQGQDLREGLLNAVTRRILEKSPRHRIALKRMLVGNIDEILPPWSASGAATDARSNERDSGTDRKNGTERKINPPKNTEESEHFFLPRESIQSAETLESEWLSSARERVPVRAVALIQRTSGEAEILFRRRDLSRSRGIRERIHRFFVTVRGFSLTATFMPCLAVGLLGLSRGESVRWEIAISALIGVIFLQISVNLYNDVSDYLKLIDLPGSPGGSGVFELGWYSPREVRNLARLAAVTGLAAGVPSLLAYPIEILTAGGLGLLGALLYSQEKMGLKYHALGDVAVFLLCGPVLTVGFSFAAFGKPIEGILPIGASLGLLACALLHMNNLHDIELDRSREFTHSRSP